MQIDTTSSPAYHARHSDLTTRVVALPMLPELILLGLLPFARPPGVGAPGAWLGREHDRAIIARLVATNWLRTAAWAAHLLLLVAPLLRVASARN